MKNKQTNTNVYEAPILHLRKGGTRDTCPSALLYSNDTAFS